MNSKLALGTAQFGLNYGITNDVGQVQTKEVRKILSYAKQNNINSIDTAIEYGDCELSLGKANVLDWRVITKLPVIPKNTNNISVWINQQIQASLLLLKIPKLGGLLLHKPCELLGKNGKEIWKIIQAKKDEGLISKIGFSIYNPDELEPLLALYKPDIVQTPYNILDRRIKSSGWLQKLNENNIEIQARSIFLQGLLLMSPIKRNKLFYKWRFLWRDLESWLVKNNISALEASLRFAMSERNFDYVIVGVETQKQLEEIIRISKSNCDLDFPESLSTSDVNLIEPVNWIC